jgi:DNA-binding transcriptional regulator YhcF (GntR family)
MARAATTVTPPSGLRVNRQSSVPVHVQLTMQVRHLIGTGALKPGMQLPTVRQLAGFLRINRNTVARALADLHRDGYLECQQGRGTFVVERPPMREGRAARSLDRLVAETLDRARRLGFTHDEILATVAAYAPAPAGARSGKPKKVRALLIECNRQELTRYRDDLETELPLSVDTLLVDELRERAAREPDMFEGYRLVITTFFHIHEVKHVVPADGPPTVALLSEANLAVLRRLTELPEGSVVGLICNTAGGSQNLLRSMQAAGLGHLTTALASVDDPWSISRMLERTRVVVCSEQSAARIKDSVPPDVDLIVNDRTLDRGGIELLRDTLAQAEADAG